MKKSLGRPTLVYPHPVFIIGSYNIKNRANIMAASWGGVCCSKPPCVCVSLREATYTYKNLTVNKAYTVNIPSVKYAKEADFAGIASGEDVDKFEKTGLTPVKSESVNAPYVEEFPVSLHCKVLDTVKIGLHTQFIGEIMDVIADEEILDEKGKPILEKVAPFCYDSANRNYYEVGKVIMRGFSTKEF